ncbi:hypothetical protein IM816_06650 [Luteibacter flocculans]|uniref:Uncharacterized protein n=1 Tax=Luteibacter flocculans TaxID=2780091 RepID=A0ABY4T4W2_9GAMM|nr:hypothetical protein [Luteibacter flocculans]URL59765.1 hypothetical protein IM816_06650 [Luteibacter flocculans]
MHRLLILLFAGLIAACGPTRNEVPSEMGPIRSSSASHVSGAASAGTKELEGEKAVADLRRWYQDTRSDCGGSTAPAFLCTGLMLRSTTSGNFLPWNPNPSSTGVSFSWLRADTNFADLVFNYTNGFIFYPKNEGVAGTGIINVLCVFPMDSDTSSRADNGCGAHPATGASSRPCEEQGINDGATWFSHFNALSASNKYTGQCGWSVRAGQPNTANRFTAFVQGRSRMPLPWWAIQNELRIASWAQNSQVPIRAFFYESGSATGLANARSDQLRYQNTFGSFAPIVRLTLPSSQGGQAAFTYATADQAVQDPGGGPGPGPDPGPGPVPGPDEYLITFEPAPIGAPINGDRPFSEVTNAGAVTVILSRLGISSQSVSGMYGRHVVVSASMVGSIYISGPLVGGVRQPPRELSFTVRVPAGGKLGIYYICADPSSDHELSVGGGEATIACPDGARIDRFYLESPQGTSTIDNIRVKYEGAPYPPQ